jgi:hypothetical protein
MAIEQRNVPSTLAHKVVRFTLALCIGLALAFYAYHRVTDPEPARQRASEEAAVLAARGILRSYLELAGEAEIVDPVSPRRKIGKSYIYPANVGWEISGHYRRSESDRWHPFLMAIDHDHQLLQLSVRDTPGNFTPAALQDGKLEVRE